MKNIELKGTQLNMLVLKITDKMWFDTVEDVFLLQFQNVYNDNDEIVFMQVEE